MRQLALSPLTSIPQQDGERLKRVSRSSQAATNRPNTRFNSYLATMKGRYQVTIPARPLHLDLLDLARRYATEPDEWAFAPRFDPTQRWYARLAVTDDHEVWLLTWLP